MTGHDVLRSLGACADGLEWVDAQPDQSPQALWETCDRADWLAWYLGKLGARDGYGSPAHRRAVLIACLCARSVSRYWSDPACELAVEKAEQWAWGDETITRGDLRAAAYDAAYASSAPAAAAADAAYSDACADACAAAAYDATYTARTVADAAATPTPHLASLADLIRAAVPEVAS